MFWLWPWMTLDNHGSESTAARRARTPGERHCRTSKTYPSRSTEPQHTPAIVTDAIRGASHDVLLQVTTTLSRTWDGLSRVFGRARHALAYDRWMHATFGWALSPMQRLLPSAAWPMVYAYPGLWGCGLPTRGAGPFLRGGEMMAAGFAWWRSFGQAQLWHGSQGWQPMLPAAPTSQSSRRANHAWTLAVEPLSAFALGLTPAIGFGLFF